MPRQLYAEKLLVSDDELDLELLTQVHAALQGKYSKTKGGLRNAGDELNTDPRFNKWDSWKRENTEGPDIYDPNIPPSGIDSVLFHGLMEMELFPKVEGARPEYCVHAYEMPEGGRMDWHNDGAFPVACTIYLNDVSGGELEVRLDKSYEGVYPTVFVEPRAGRAVCIKGGTEHRVLPVVGGLRKTLQIFVHYTRE